MGNQYPLLLKLTRLSSNHTKLELSPVALAEHPLTTVSLLLDMELRTVKTTSLSRTPGVLPGVTTFMSRLVPLMSVVSLLNHLTQQLTDVDPFNISISYIQ